MQDEDGISQMFDYLKDYTGESNWINVESEQRIAENEPKFVTHDGSSFDSLIILNIVPTWCRVISRIIFARFLITVKSCNGFCDVKESYKRKPQHKILLCSMNQVKESLLNLQKIFA